MGLPRGACHFDLSRPKSLFLCETAKGVPRGAQYGSHFHVHNMRCLKYLCFKRLSQVPIPVWNDVDDDSPPGSPHFEYIRDYRYGHSKAQQMAEQAERAFMAACDITCGIQVSEMGSVVFCSGYHRVRV